MHADAGLCRRRLTLHMPDCCVAWHACLLSLTHPTLSTLLKLHPLTCACFLSLIQLTLSLHIPFSPSLNFHFFWAPRARPGPARLASATSATSARRCSARRGCPWSGASPSSTRRGGAGVGAGVGERVVFRAWLGRRKGARRACGCRSRRRRGGFGSRRRGNGVSRKLLEGH